MSPVAGQDLHLLHGLVHQSEPERRRFDPDAADRAAEVMVFSCGNHGGQQSVAQRLVHQGLVRGHALHIGGHALAIDRAGRG